MAKRRLKKKTVRIFSNVILVIAICVGLFSGYNLWKERQKYAVAKQSYEDIRNQTVVKPVPTPEIDEEKRDVYKPRKDIDWEALKAIDENVVAWIEMEGSSIDYPVAHGVNNDQYLRHLIDGNYNEAGTIFVDYRNQRGFNDRNTVLYGHHMLDEPLMFAEIENYESQEYYDSHKVIMIHTPDGEYDMYPVAGYKTTGTGGYLKFEFSDDQDYLNYVSGFVQRSTFVSEETITADDQMMLLSTCSYDVANGRFVLIGKLIKADGPEMHEYAE
ncbi:MAG: class B sortase [Erysipelotrichaceae bacterium]|nr:class B sortase [Erysipelotrichaceae bacterium]